LTTCKQSWTPIAGRGKRLAGEYPREVADGGTTAASLKHLVRMSVYKLRRHLRSIRGRLGPELEGLQTQKLL